MGADAAQPFLSIRHNGAQLTAAIAMPEKPWESESVCNNQTAVAALSQTANTSGYPDVRNETFLRYRAARAAASREFGSVVARPSSG